MINSWANIMKTSSCKAKGRKGQQEVVKILLETLNRKIKSGTFGSGFSELAEDDIRSCPMGSRGEDILLSPKARKLIPWDIEVKRGKAFNIVKACKQAHVRGSKHEPVGIGRYDRDKTWYACVELNYLLSLLKN